MRNLGKPLGPGPITWVQTEKRAHAEWIELSRELRSASDLAHLLVSQVGPDNAVVATHAVLAEMLEVSTSTIKRSIAVLVKRNWVEVVELGAKGGAKAYVLNDRIAWSGPRDQRPSVQAFRATVLASSKDQPAEALQAEKPPLRKIPVIMRGEVALLVGPDVDPPSQPELEGIPPAVVELDGGEMMDPQTGELYQLK